MKLYLILIALSLPLQAAYKLGKSKTTVIDTRCKLMWTRSPDLNGDGKINTKDKLTYTQALAYAKKCRVGGHDDWRVPSIKELYSLIDFKKGIDISSYQGSSTEGLSPFIDTKYFDFGYGDKEAGERLIDSQMVTSTLYTATTMRGAKTMFGVNFADGRIKGYGIEARRNRGEKTFYVYLVRGHKNYGKNKFIAHKNGTITDKSTGLMWAQADSGKGMNWAEAHDYARNSKLAGYKDWRLPTAKELQYIVDYSRAPESTKSAAISPLFKCTSITNEAGEKDYASYWTSTTHKATPRPNAPKRKQQGNNPQQGAACYIAFGRAMGCMHGQWLDVHGAGAQRSDPKAGVPSRFPQGRGPQGDAIRIYNYVRLVRTARKSEASSSIKPQ